MKVYIKRNPEEKVKNRVVICFSYNKEKVLYRQFLVINMLCIYTVTDINKNVMVYRINLPWILLFQFRNHFVQSKIWHSMCMFKNFHSLKVANISIKSEYMSSVRLWVLLTVERKPIVQISEAIRCMFNLIPWRQVNVLYSI